MNYQRIFTKEKSFSYKIIDNIHTYVWGGWETTNFFSLSNICFLCIRLHNQRKKKGQIASEAWAFKVPIITNLFFVYVRVSLVFFYPNVHCKQFCLDLLLSILFFVFLSGVFPFWHKVFSYQLYSYNYLIRTTMELIPIKTNICKLRANKHGEIQSWSCNINLKFDENGTIKLVSSYYNLLQTQIH